MQFAPFPYNSRKIYAHMYVDDRGYGWVEGECAMIDVLHNILISLIGICVQDADAICAKINRGEDVSYESARISKYLDSYWV